MEEMASSAASPALPRQEAVCFSGRVALLSSMWQMGNCSPVWTGSWRGRDPDSFTWSSCGMVWDRTACSGRPGREAAAPEVCDETPAA